MPEESRGPIHQLLHGDHERLEALFEEVHEATISDVDAFTLGPLWTRFDQSLLAHLEAEEQLLFPALEQSHPEQITHLRQVHDEIRSRLDTMDIAVDLHLVRARAVDELLELLRAHAAEEDASLYPWAEEEGEARQRDLIDRLGAALLQITGRLRRSA